MKKDISLVILLTSAAIVGAVFLDSNREAHPQIYSVTPQQGAVGTTGATPNITIGTVTTRSAGTGATASISGTTPNLSLSLGIPNGATGGSGSAGAAATIAVGAVSSLPTGSTPTITNSGSSSAATFNFAIPVGLTGSSGSNGSNGSAATIAVGSTSTLAAGASATVANSGSSSAATFNFGIPQGLVGATGPQGPSGSNAIGSPNARTVAFATAYQATDPTRPAFVQVAISCTASVALGSAQTNTVELRIGSTNSVATGGGTQVDVASTSLSVSIIISIGWTGQQTLKANLPIGWYFSPRQTAGTGCSVASSSDQSLG